MYKIEVSMTPHREPGMQTKNYYWNMLEYRVKWCNVGHGWSDTPDEAWRDANEYYKKFINGKGEK